MAAEHTELTVSIGPIHFKTPTSRGARARLRKRETGDWSATSASATFYPSTSSDWASKLANAAVNQIELHPYWPQVDLVEFHRGHGIITEALESLGKGSDLLASPVIAAIANEHHVTPAQTVLAWHLHNGAIPIPKATAVERQRENLDIFGFSLTPEDVEKSPPWPAPMDVSPTDSAVHQEF